MLPGMAKDQALTDEVSREIVASPEAVWLLVADVTNMARWSPTIERCEWTGGATGPEVGARFVGHNRQQGIKWSRECVISTCEPGREFTFHTLFKGSPSTHWSYRFEPSDGGTKVTESYEVESMPRWVRAMRKLPGMIEKGRQGTRDGMAQTLDGIADLAERGS
jgi:uncharacterized protein YndB with AHSA1/START domain